MNLINRRFWICTACLLVLCLLGGAITCAALFRQEHTVSVGRYLQTDDGGHLLITGNLPVILHSDSDAMFEGLSAGDEIQVTHGPIAESYPGQTQVYDCRLISEGKASDVPEEVTARLSRLGWYNKGNTAAEGSNTDAPAQKDPQPAMSAASDHSHTWAKEPQTVEDPVTGYCGNTVTSVRIDGKNYSFWGSESVALTDIMINLRYDAQKHCDCEAELYVDTEWEKGCEVNLTKGFVRSACGQADLTEEQTARIREVLRKLESGEVMLLGAQT